jgi:AcrR family transcriptional regulator
MKSETHEKLIAALLETASIREAAKASGMSEATVFRRLQDKDFQTEYRSARRQVVERSIAELQAATGQAVETLRRNLNCQNPSSEIRAATAILDNAFRGVEVYEFTHRLEKIENEIGNQNGKNRTVNGTRRF